MSATRDVIIDAACELLERQGLYATGLSQLVAESGAPRGSLYYYFPSGKDQIAEAAIERAGYTVAAHITADLATTDDPAAAVRNFVLRIADQVEASHYRGGGPLATVAMETATTNERLNLACRAAYDRLRAAFYARLREAAFDEHKSRQLATFITAAIEGGTLLCRTYHSGEPLREVAEQLGVVIAATGRS